ncbi:PTS glucitol/sorbitol transporter subunit IIA [Lactobacillus acetotolerans]|jgi:PTS system glucitol/sorbitol-specific IIA component|uniref:PTS glucitol/sorbitol transporter subunit IIA n=1 Tax=Lactobacillus acetotolerans TaxID=1600 RepID=UPI000EE32C77|nr:PTS glucitol/sorbitol transporter subunit IIA [Lactobacillus acetotolerans]QJD72936.1 PTS glucitol/sorbitol transporter subunit IIA [Lactobacillus acetotolerans]HCX40485.1 PTS sorbitol transporter subunit IIA [Lactobacillus acetotolerans]
MAIQKKTIFETEVKEIGKDAQDFKAVNMLIFFGDEAPTDLRDSCFIIDVNDVNGKIEKGMVLRIGDTDYKITAVGNEVNTNLKNLGHIAVKFTGEEEAELPGSLYVEKKQFPDIKVGTKVTIS